jgi:light-regulated signal transduction histidine kinase (bacteriophytochrome)
MHEPDPKLAYRVSLENCASEPIHIPGSIQANGALLAFKADGSLCAHSANVEAMLGVAVRLGDNFQTLLQSLAPAIIDAVAEIIGCAREEDVATSALELEIAGQHFDVVIHCLGGTTIVEFEHRSQSIDLIVSFALKAHQAINGLKTARSINGLLQRTVQEVAALTGFDRVMAYRFRHDDSGDVVAEHLNAPLQPFLGRRYPASDIPVQARRLYLINTLRIISDANTAPVALLGAPGDAPLDLSQSVLRSVSPIHIEYLQNMGVGASMSISIVINGALWGLIACHHMSAHLVPYSIRMSCDVLAQVVSSRVQQMLSREEAEFASEGAKLQTRLADAVLHADDIFGELTSQSDTLKQLLDADATILVQHSKLLHSDSISTDLALLIAKSLPVESKDMVLRNKRSDWAEMERDQLDCWVGMLALPLDQASSGWIIALRREEIETIVWGGKDEKLIKVGPNGPRLSPRGSFEEYKEIVRDSARPWSAPTVRLARALLDELNLAFRARHQELEQSRAQLLAMLGHDLRDPLNSITLATAVLKHDDRAESRVVQRISIASGRMQRLISDVLDMSRMQSGIGLGLKREPKDVSALFHALISELVHAHPHIDYQSDIQDSVIAEIDEDRLLQAIGNLLGNARHHGDVGSPVRLKLHAGDDNVSVSVANVAGPIPAEIQAEMFNPFKRSSLDNARNRSGLGLGLYITHQIALGHGGALEYRHIEPEVVFTLVLPLRAAP